MSGAYLRKCGGGGLPPAVQGNLCTEKAGSPGHAGHVGFVASVQLRPFTSDFVSPLDAQHVVPSYRARCRPELDAT